MRRGKFAAAAGVPNGNSGDDGATSRDFHREIAIARRVQSVGPRATMTAIVSPFAASAPLMRCGIDTERHAR